MTAPATAPPRVPPSPQRRTWVEMVMGLPVSVTLRGPGARSDRVDKVVQAL